MAKPVRTVAQLETLITTRLRKVREVADDLRADSSLKVEIKNPYWHERDAEGCNWNIGHVSGTVSPYLAALNLIVTELRQSFDIQSPDGGADTGG